MSEIGGLCVMRSTKKPDPCSRIVCTSKRGNLCVQLWVSAGVRVWIRPFYGFRGGIREALDTQGYDTDRSTTQRA